MLFDKLKEEFNKLPFFDQLEFPGVVSYYLEGGQENMDIVKEIFKGYGLLPWDICEKISNLIDPSVPEKESGCRMSYGPEPYGYTLRLNLEKDEILAPGEVKLVSTLETINMPTNIVAYIFPKSSYCRQGLFFSVAPIESGYRGTLSFSVFNASKNEIILVAKQGIIQIQFVRPFSEASSDYSKGGRYQNSTGTVTYQASKK